MPAGRGQPGEQVVGQQLLRLIIEPLEEVRQRRGRGEDACEEGMPAARVQLGEHGQALEPGLRRPLDQSEPVRLRQPA